MQAWMIIFSKPFDDKQLLEAILRRPAETAMEEPVAMPVAKLYDLTMAADRYPVVIPRF